MGDKMDELLEGFYNFKKSMEQRIDGLEEKMDKKFEEVDKRFDEVDKRFDKVDKRFDKVDKKLKEHDKTFEEFFKRIGSVRRIAGENMSDIEHLSEHFREKIGF